MAQKKIDLSHLDKQRVAENFSKAAHTYNSVAEAHRQSAQILIDLFPNEIDGTIADLGCGTGIMLNKIINKFSTKQVLGVDIAKGMIDYCQKQWLGNPNISFLVADIDKVKLPPTTTIITANCVFQWLPDLNESIANIKNNLSEDGILIFSELIDGSTPELAQACEDAQLDLPLLPYRSNEEIKEVLVQQKLKIIANQVCDITINYPSAFLALKSFQGIGAQLTSNITGKHLTPKQIRQLCQCYETNFANTIDQIPVTYRIAFFVAQK